ncbi:serine hydrolase domain-containing protein [Inquilinus limosus]|uniref:serine hydrolase domain-containing protein n=1 Tax=Inquilinus limosus TaxID=171674 RepID=UPI0003FD038C|nr:serine hydrolase domain-containing protein [Inquilinus limosus]
MAGGELRWSAAAEAAAGIAAAWGPGEPGGAVAVFDTREIRAEACGGVESLARDVAFSGDTVVRYASVTKHVFAALALTQDGIGLDDPLGRLLPALRGGLAAVTVGRALDMTGGLPDLRETLSLLGVPQGAAVSREESLDVLSRLTELNFPPGQEISYSNTGYRLVDAALLRRGIGFAGLVRDRIADPLGIGFRVPETWFDPIRGLAPGYWKDATGAWQLAASGQHLSASGCLTGSLRDLVRWQQAVLADRGPGQGVLARLGAPRHLADGRPTGYGLGLAWSRLGAHRLVGHGGSLLGYKTYFLLDPEQGVGAAVVSNREDTVSHGTALKLMAALLGEDLPRRGTSIPDGLYVAEQGPEWLELKDGVASFLGTGETLYRGEDGWSVSLSAHLPMRLRWADGAVEGEIGHAARRFRPIEPDGALDRVQGEWLCPEHHAAFTIAGERMETGAGPIRAALPLVPLGGGRLVAEGREEPWPKRIGLAFEGDTVRLALNRSRILRFRRG